MDYLTFYARESASAVCASGGSLSPGHLRRGTFNHQNTKGAVT